MSAPTLADLDRLEELRPKRLPNVMSDRRFILWCTTHAEYLMLSHRLSSHLSAAARKQLEEESEKRQLEGEHGNL